MALTALVVMAGAPATVEQFRFNPPDGTTYEEIVQTTRVRDLGSLGKQTDEQEASGKIEIKRTPEGFSLVATLLSGSLTRNGRKVESPLLSAPIGMSFTFDIDSAGRLRSIRGFDEVVTKMLAALPPETVRSVSALINEKALVNRETAEWNGRIGSFLGRPVKVGATWTSTDRYVVPTGGTIVYHTLTRIVGREKYEGQECVRVRYSYNTDARAMRAVVNKVMKNLPKSTKRSNTKPRVASVSLTGSGERLIEPATMLIRSESVSRTIKMPMDVPGEAGYA